MVNPFPKAPDPRFEFIHQKITKENIDKVAQIMKLKEGDFLVDLSTNIDCISIYSHCRQNGIHYLNTALEIWEDEDDAVSYPSDANQAYKTSLGYRRNLLSASKYWDTKQGTTAIFDMGFNPGQISQCVKRGLEDCARDSLQKKQKDIDLVALNKYLKERNHSKLAQTLKVHTIHCSELDTQLLAKAPKDYKEKLYNTWSCRGFLTEGLVPIQVARGSHEDKVIEGLWTLENDTLLVSNKPSVQTTAKTWVPNQNIKGVLIPHGEAYSIREYLQDPETGYAPSQYYVYDYNYYARQFVAALPKTANLQNVNPDSEVIHPINHPTLKGVDKVGAMIIMENNRGWWTGSIMDEVDASQILGGRFSPTVLQVAASSYAGFLWAYNNPNRGSTYPEFADTDFVINKALPYMGRFVSVGVDLKKTHLKDCHKLQDFLC